MSRSISASMKRALNQSASDEVFLLLLEISHPSLSEPILVTNNPENVISNGDTYISLPFDLVLPDTPENGVPVAKLQIDNIDRMIVQAVREMQPGTPCSVIMRVVLASDPDYVEIEFLDFIMTNVTYDALTVQGDLSIENFSSKPYPAGTFSPRFFGGLF